MSNLFHLTVYRTNKRNPEKEVVLFDQLISLQQAPSEDRLTKSVFAALSKHYEDSNDFQISRVTIKRVI